MVNLHYRIIHNLITGPKPPEVEHVITDYLDEYPEDLERLHTLILKAEAVIKARGDNGTNV
jgi:hypothetical protein